VAPHVQYLNASGVGQLNQNREKGGFRGANSVEDLRGSRHAVILLILSNSAGERDSSVRAPIRDVLPDVPYRFSEAE
jgi:hypothetical protein